MHKLEFTSGYPPPSEEVYQSEFDLTHLQGLQVTESWNHSDVWRKVVVPPISDIGGDFLMQRTAVVGKANSVTASGSKVYGPQVYSSHYSGPMMPVHPGELHFPPFNRSSDDNLLEAGTTAIARCKPTNAAADASVFLGELFREGLPSLIGSTLKKWRNKTFDAKKAVGEEYLNTQFGWLPIQRDIGKFIYAVYAAETILKQYERDAGRVVRRRYEFPSELKAEVKVFSSDGVAITDDDLVLHRSSPSGACLRSRLTGKRQWFSGSFIYYIPKGDSRSAMAGDALRVKKLLGLSLTPETVWNLAPWSWAVDWFSNAGDVISNLSDMAFDSLVLRHGYIMEHSFVQDAYSFLGSTGYWSEDARPYDLLLLSETKMRKRATPFGFGIPWSGLTPRQIAISIALGLTRW